MDSHGTPFVRKMAEVLWHIDGQHAKLQALIPECFLRFCGYNDPVSRKQKPHCLDQAKLSGLADDLYEMLEQPWMCTRKWQEMKKYIVTLADSLRKYADYLKHQSEVVSANHGLQESVRNLSTCSSPQLLPLKPALKVTDAAKGVQIRAMLYTHSSGNSMGNTHFVWRVPDEQPESEVLAQSTSVILKVQEQIPHFHTRAMRSRFMQVFGLVTSVKPAILREMYRQVAGVSGSAHDKQEAGIDERVRSAIDMEDPDVIIDLRAHNNGQPSRYDVF